MKCLLSVLLTMLVASATLAGQTVTIGPVTTSMKIAFDCSTNIVPQTPTECQTYEWRLRDGTFIPVTRCKI